MKQIFALGFFFASTVALAAPVKTNIPETFDVVCSLGDAPVKLTLSQSAADIYDCVESDHRGEKTASYTPRIEKMQISIGAQTYDAKPQAWAEAKACRASQDFAVFVMWNDLGTYTTALRANGEVTVSFFAKPVCWARPRN